MQIHFCTHTYTCMHTHTVKVPKLYKHIFSVYILYKHNRARVKKIFAYLLICNQKMEEIQSVLLPFASSKYFNFCAFS